MDTERIDRKSYINIVRFTLGSMMEQAQKDREFNLLTEVVSYYLNKIKPDGRLSEGEFLCLCKEVEQEQRH